MATRFHSSFPTLKEETFTINIDDADFVGTSTEITLDSDGFRHQIGGDGKNRLNPVMGSVINIGVLVDPATETAIEDFAEDLRVAAEGRFTVRIDFDDGGGDELWWVGYILTDLGGFQDLAPAYIYSISATDGLGRLKGIEYFDDSGITDVPYGKLPMLEHLLNCLNQDPLSALYFDASTDIFLQTVVNWQDDNIGSPSAAKCPLARTRVSGEVFAKPSTANQGDTWVYKNCYEVIRHIAEHFAARIYFSGGCYRFEQINERAQDNYPERRFARDGTLISSTLTASADKLIHNTVASHKVATVLFNYLPALRQVSVKYDHNTNRNYIASTAFKWYKDSLNNDPLNRPNVKFDADSYMRISGRVYFDLSVTTYTEPWRYVFGMDVTLTDGNQLRSLTRAGVDGSGNPLNIIIHEPVTWEISSADYEISTDFNYQDSVQSFLDFAVYTPVVPSGPDGFTIDFYPKGGYDNEDNNHSVNLNNWKFGELILIIVGIDNADNYEMDRDYKVYNDEVGNSDTLSFKHIFGHAVQKWTPAKLETSADGITWDDTTQSWRQGSDTTDYEFGQLFATEVMAGAITPLKMLDGTLGGNDFYPHVRIVTSDDIGWLLMSGELRAKSGQWSGSWFQAGTNRSITHGPVIKNPGIPPVFGGSGPGQFHPGSGVKGAPGGIANVAMATQATNYSSSALTGTITSIPLQYAVKANAYLAGDDIFMLNPQTGDMVGFTVATTANAGDTSLSVNSTILDNDIPKGSYLLYSALNKYTGEGGAGETLPAGTNKYTLRHNGTSWAASSLLQNDGTALGVGIAPAGGVSGKMVSVKQTSTADGVSVIRSSSSVSLNLYHDGNATLESAGGNNLKLKTGSSSQIVIEGGGGGGQIAQVGFVPGASVTSVFGGSCMFFLQGIYAPTTAGGDFSILTLGSSINQTASANQITRALYISPTLTALLAAFRGIEYVPSTETFLYQPSGTGVKNHLIGNLGLGTGTTSPAAKLDIVANGATSGTSSLIITDSSSNQHVKVRDDGVAIIRATAMVSGAPSIAPGTGMGTTPTVDLVVGGCNGFIILFTSGTSPTAGASIFTATIAKSYPNGCVATFSANNDATAAIIASIKVSGTGNNSVTLSMVGGASLTAATQYALHVILYGY